MSYCDLNWISTVFLILFFFSCNNETDDISPPDYKNHIANKSKEIVPEAYISKRNITSAARKLFQWHSENLKYYYGKNSWSTSTFYIGAIESYNIFKDTVYYTATEEWLSRSNWEIQISLNNDLADYHAKGQVLIEYARINNNDTILYGLKNKIDSIIYNNVPSEEFWWWADALFMSPPVFSNFGDLYNQERYFMYLNKSFWQVYDRLFDQEYQLFYRDKRFINIKNTTGEKIFWLRGNGWVIAGILRILEYLPPEDPYYIKYINLLKNMSEALIYFQQEDGLWRTNLLDATEYPGKESSGSALICYALAKGINMGILQEKVYSNAVINAWNGLRSCIINDMYLGFVQPPSFKPEPVQPNNYEDFAAGAFLLAATEVYKMR